MVLPLFYKEVGTCLIRDRESLHYSVKAALKAYYQVVNHLLETCTRGDTTEQTDSQMFCFVNASAELSLKFARKL